METVENGEVSETVQPEDQKDLKELIEPEDTGAVAPDYPQEQSGLVVVLRGQAIYLSPLSIQDFPLVDIITGGTPSGALDRAKAKSDLINVVLSRSRLTPEHLQVLKADPLVTYRAVGAAIMRELIAAGG